MNNLMIIQIVDTRWHYNSEIRSQNSVFNKLYININIYIFCCCFMRPLVQHEKESREGNKCFSGARPLQNHVKSTWLFFLNGLQHSRVLSSLNSVFAEFVSEWIWYFCIKAFRPEHECRDGRTDKPENATEIQKYMNINSEWKLYWTSHARRWLAAVRVSLSVGENCWAGACLQLEEMLE